MKYETRFVTQSGSVYVYSYMCETLHSIDAAGVRTFVLSRPTGAPVIREGERVRICGQRFDSVRRTWRPYSIDTSPVVSKEYLLDHAYLVMAEAVRATKDFGPASLAKHVTAYGRPSR